MSSSQTSPVVNNGVTFSWSSSNIATGSTNSGFKANSNLTITLPTGSILKGISKSNGNSWGSEATIKVYTGSNSNGTNIATIIQGTNEYTISSNNTGTTYFLSNSTSKNAWIKTLTITYETTSGGGGNNNDDDNDGCDELTYAVIGMGKVSSGNATYTNFSNKTVTSSAIYAGNILKFNNSSNPSDVIQLRATSPSGIVTTTSGGSAKSISVVWNTNTQSGRTLDVYGSNTAYTSASDLYDNSKQGTKLGSIVYDTSTSLEIQGTYKYIGLRSADKTMYLDKVTICWSTCEKLAEINGSISLGQEGRRCRCRCRYRIRNMFTT